MVKRFRLAINSFLLTQLQVECSYFHVCIKQLQTECSKVLGAMLLVSFEWFNDTNYSQYFKFRAMSFGVLNLIACGDSMVSQVTLHGFNFNGICCKCIVKYFKMGSDLHLIVLVLGIMVIVLGLQLHVSNVDITIPRLMIIGFNCNGQNFKFNGKNTLCSLESYYRGDLNINIVLNIVLVTNS